MSQFTCINCDARFANAEIQREHYKTDWHRYNLKRRVAQLPPVTAEEFQQRVLSARSATETAIEEQQMSIYCTACRKQFGNQKAHDNHLNSKKHKEALDRFEQQKKHQHNENDTEPAPSVCVKSIIEPRPHPALAAAASGKGRLAFAERAMQMEADEDDDDGEFEDIDEEEVRLECTRLSDCYKTQLHLTLFLGGFR